MTPRGFDVARVTLIVVLFTGFVVLRALHDIPVSMFQWAASAFVGAVLGATSTAARPARKTDTTGTSS